MDVLQSPIGRVSWPFVFEDGDPREEGPSKYKLTLMLPKTTKAFKTLGINPAQKKKLLKEVEGFVTDLRKQAEDMAKSTFKSKWKESRFNPVLDGDEKGDSWEGNKHFWLLRMKTRFKPKVGAPKAGEKILDGDDDPQSGFYAGCWARVALSLYTYNTGGNKGVGLGLSYVQKAWNDEPFSTGGFEFEDDIEELDIDEDDVEDFEDDDDDIEDDDFE